MSLPQCTYQAGRWNRIANETTNSALAWRKAESAAESVCKLGKLCTSVAGKLNVPALGFICCQMMQWQCAMFQSDAGRSDAYWDLPAPCNFVMCHMSHMLCQTLWPMLLGTGSTRV